MGRVPSANRALGNVGKVSLDIPPNIPLRNHLIFRYFGNVGYVGNVFRGYLYRARVRACACVRGRKNIPHIPHIPFD